MDVELLDRLCRACATDGNAAGVAIAGRYRPPVPGSKVMPPTYPPPQGRSAEASWRYLSERRLIDGAETETVLLDSVPSEANRIESTFNPVALSGRLPVVELAVTVDSESASVTSWTAPHRHADAYFEHATLDGTAFWETAQGHAILVAAPEDAAALYEWFPGALIFGSWTARKKGRQGRFPRLYTSDIVGLNPLFGDRAAMRYDPLNLTKTTGTDGIVGGGKGKLSEHGLGHIPASSAPGGVSIEEARRQAWLSFAGLRRLSFGRGEEADAAGRAALAALALLGDRLAFGGSSLWLRSGCDLLRVDEHMSWVTDGTADEPLTVTRALAWELFDLARASAAGHGLDMAETPLRLQPSDKLKAEIAFTLLRAEGGDES